MGWQGSPVTASRSEEMVSEAQRKRLASQMADAARAYLEHGSSNNRIALEASLDEWEGPQS